MKLPPKKLSRVDQRIAKDKAALLEILEETPVVLAACAKAGINRSTYYRWFKDDADFREQVNERKGMGVHMVNDMAESVLISKIQAKDEKTAKYWLEKHHSTYGPRRKPPPMPPPPEERERFNGPYIIKIDS